MKTFRISYVAFGLCVTLLAPAEAANRGGGHRGGGSFRGGAFQHGGTAFRGGGGAAFRGGSTRVASRPVVFSQGIRSPRLSGMRAADSRWRGTGWHGNRLGDRDWHRHRYSNRIAFFRGGYSPYSYGSYSRNWDYGYPYYQTAWDYSGYGGGYNSDYPYYNTTYSAPAYYGAPATTNRRARVTQIQRQLAAEGYYRGPIDGILGPMTRAALYAYQQDH